jgi:hypothetical protein
VPKTSVVNLRAKHQASGTNRSAPEMIRANTVASLPSLRTDQAPQPDPTLPPLIYQSIVWLLRHGLQEEGLFRISANSTDMKALKAQFDAQRPVTLEPTADPHTIAGLLKVYFRDMTKPFFGPISAELYKTAEIGTPDLRYEGLKIAVSKLSQGNQSILSNLVMLLREVAKFSDKNCMTPRNMGICWAPTLFGGGAAGTEVVADLIEGYWHIFHNEPIAPVSPQPKKKPLPTLPPDQMQRRSDIISSASLPHLKAPQLTPSTSPKLSHSPRGDSVPGQTSPGRVKRPLSDIVIPPFSPPSQPLPPLPVKSSPNALSPRPDQPVTSPRAVPNSMTAASPRPLSGGAPLPPPQANKPKRHVKAVTDVAN